MSDKSSEDRWNTYAERFSKIVQQWHKGIHDSGFTDNTRLASVWENYRLSSPKLFQSTEAFYAQALSDKRISPTRKKLPKFFAWLREEGHAQQFIDAVKIANLPQVDADFFAQQVENTKSAIDTLTNEYPEFTAAPEKSGGRGRGSDGKSVRLAAPPPWEQGG